MTLNESLGKIEKENRLSRRDFLRYVAGAAGTGVALSLIPQDLQALAEPHSLTPVLESMDIEGTQTRSASLETVLSSHIEGLKKKKVLNENDSISITVYDIDHNIKFASINEDVTRMAASTIKDYVMLAIFTQIQAGKLKYTKEIKKLLAASIQHSDNPSTNKLIAILGGHSKADKIIATNYPYFRNTRILEIIPDDGRTYKNTTSTHDLSIFYNQMWQGRLPYSAEMKHYLSLPQLIGHDRIYDGTCIPKGTRLYDKTGTVYGSVADSGILEMKDGKSTKPYVINVIIEDKTRPNAKASRSSRQSWMHQRANVIRSVSEIVYNHLFNFHTGINSACGNQEHS